MVKKSLKTFFFGITILALPMAFFFLGPAPKGFKLSHLSHRDQFSYNNFYLKKRNKISSTPLSGDSNKSTKQVI